MFLPIFRTYLWCAGRSTQNVDKRLQNFLLHLRKFLKRGWQEVHHIQYSCPVVPNLSSKHYNNVHRNLLPFCQLCALPGLGHDMHLKGLRPDIQNKIDDSNFNNRLLVIYLAMMCKSTCKCRRGLDFDLTPKCFVGSVHLSVRLGLWDLCCAPPSEYRTLLGPDLMHLI